MAWALLDSITALTAAGGSGYVLNYPAGGPADGDLLVAGVNSDTTVTTPGGWTLSPGASRVASQGAYVYWKVAGASEPSSVTITTSGNNNTAITFFRYSGAAASPLDTAGVTNGGVDSTPGATTPAVTAGPLAGSGELLLCYAMLHGATAGAGTSPSWSGGPAQAADTGLQGTSDTAVQQFAGSLLTASGSYSPVCTWTIDFNDRYVITLAFTASSGTDTTVTMGSALAVTAAAPAAQLMSLTSPAYASAATDLGGGSGSWVNPGNADGAPDSSYATWTAP